MLVATAIMGIAVVGLLSGLAASSRNAARLRDYDRAVQLAQLRMNEVLLDEAFPRNADIQGEFDPSITGGIEAGWIARVSPFELPPIPSPGQLSLDRVSLQVWWVSGSGRRTLAVEAYKRRILAPEDIPPVVAPQ
jgi:type II secretory pathway pseudopilin PulG